jgi:Na+-translocating ferredoxin:NAD+ oxidoreductase RnfE subunit
MIISFVDSKPIRHPSYFIVVRIVIGKVNVINAAFLFGFYSLGGEFW